ncbi:MAG: amino acid adenylation domain-containing protein, partial [Chloroflexi bacterium]
MAENRVSDLNLAPEKFLPLSPMQVGMLFHSISIPHSGVDTQHIVMTLREQINFDLFQQAWNSIVAKHDILRASFEWENVEFPCQIIQAHAPVEIIQHDWQSLPADVQNSRFQAFVKQDRLAGFDLAQAPALRINLFQFDQDLFKCVWAFHHIILDGRSFTIILQELFSTYDALLADETPQLPQRRPFTEYLNWYQEKDFSQSESYWRDQLTGFSAPTPLAIAKQTNNHAHVATASEEVELVVPANAVQKMAAFAAQNGVTMNTLVQGAWGLAWHHYTNDKDVVFGATRACRHGMDGLQDMVGVFINTLPIRAQIASGMTLVGYLQQIRAQHVAVRPYEHTPLSDVQKWSDVTDGASLFDTLVVFERYDLNSNLRGRGGAWLNREFHYKGQTNFPLTLMAYHHDDLILRLEYDPEVFSLSIMSRLLQHLQRLLVAMSQHGNGLALTLPYLTKDERSQILDQWNPPYELAQVNAPIHHFIEAQVVRTPEKTAVSFQTNHLTYQQLNEKSNQFAHYLQAQGIKPGTFVGICLGRSLNTIISLLGVLKAGATYIPLDPQYPRERLAHMIHDSQMPLLVTETAVIDHLPESSTTILNIDQISDALANSPTENPAPTATLDDLAYIIYTSGSTGKPKGVKVPHRGLTNFIQSMAKAPGMTADDVMVAVTTISFDIHGLEMFLPLYVGAKLVIVADETTVDGHGLAKLIDDVAGTVLQATPATWQMLLDAEWNGRSHLKMLCGGEPLPRRLANKLLTKGGELWNMYGPTETTIWSTISKVEPGNVPITIGRPIDNTSVYILDEHLQQTAVGIIGELCIGGAGVTQGYLNRDELTQDRFLPNPYRTGDTIYKTGDLARYNADGTL